MSPARLTVSDVRVPPPTVAALEKLVHLIGVPVSEHVIADKGYDSQALRESIEARGSQPIIPSRKNNIRGNDAMDWCLYKYRQLVENMFARLNLFSSVDWWQPGANVYLARV